MGTRHRWAGPPPLSCGTYRGKWTPGWLPEDPPGMPLYFEGICSPIRICWTVGRAGRWSGRIWVPARRRWTNPIYRAWNTTRRRSCRPRRQNWSIWLWGSVRWSRYSARGPSTGCKSQEGSRKLLLLWPLPRIDSSSLHSSSFSRTKCSHKPHLYSTSLCIDQRSDTSSLTLLGQAMRGVRSWWPNRWLSQTYKCRGCSLLPVQLAYLLYYILSITWFR